MNRNHNPIALLIEDFQNHWAKEITPSSQVKMVRWLIKPEDADLYDGFLKIENSEHGKLAEGFHLLYTPCDDENTFSRALISSFIQGIRADTGMLKRFADEGILIDLDEGQYITSPHPSTKDDKDLLSLFDDFKNCIGGSEMKLVVALTPKYIRKTSEFCRWLKRIYHAGIPQNIRILFFDDVHQESYKELVRYAPTEIKSFHVPADLQKAIEEIANTANPGNPKFGFTALLLKMGNAAKDNDYKTLDLHASEAIALAIKQKNLGMHATVYIIHCGLILNNKDYSKMIALLDQGQKVLQRAKATKDVAEPTLQIQYYAYYSMTYFHAKKFELALDYALMQAQTCLTHQMHTMAVGAFNHASDIAVKHAPEKNIEILQQAFSAAKDIEPELIQYSDTIFICHKVQCLRDRQYGDWKNEAYQWMEDVYGANWQTLSSNKTNYYRTQIEESPAFKH